MRARSLLLCPPLWTQNEPHADTWIAGSFLGLLASYSQSSRSAATSSSLATYLTLKSTTNRCVHSACAARPQLLGSSAARPRLLSMHGEYWRRNRIRLVATCHVEKCDSVMWVRQLHYATPRSHACLLMGHAGQQAASGMLDGGWSSGGNPSQSLVAVRFLRWSPVETRTRF